MIEIDQEKAQEFIKGTIFGEVFQTILQSCGWDSPLRELFAKEEELIQARLPLRDRIILKATDSFGITSCLITDGEQTPREGWAEFTLELNSAEIHRFRAEFCKSFSCYGGERYIRIATFDSIRQLCLEKLGMLWPVCDVCGIESLRCGILEVNFTPLDYKIAEIIRRKADFFVVKQNEQIRGINVHSLLDFITVREQIERTIGILQRPKPNVTSLIEHRNKATDHGLKLNVCGQCTKMINHQMTAKKILEIFPAFSPETIVDYTAGFIDPEDLSEILSVKLECKIYY